jgi:hypothetical protein
MVVPRHRASTLRATRRAARTWSGARPRRRPAVDVAGGDRRCRGPRAVLSCAPFCSREC